MPRAAQACSSTEQKGWFKSKALRVLWALEGSPRRCSGLGARLLRTEPRKSSGDLGQPRAQPAVVFPHHGMSLRTQWTPLYFAAFYSLSSGAGTARHSRHRCLQRALGPPSAPRWAPGNPPITGVEQIIHPFLLPE